MTDLLGVDNSESAATENAPTESVQTSERPDWLPENFKTPHDLVKSYNELGKKIREKTEAPESYTLPEGLKYDVPDALLASFKDAGMTQMQAEAVMRSLDNTFIPALAEAQKSVEMNRLAQAWSMSPDSGEFTQRRAQIAEWAKANLDAQVVSALASSSSGVQALEKLMQDAIKTVQTSSASGNGAAPRLTLREVNEMVADKRYGADLDYTAWVERRVAEAVKNGPLPQ